MREHWRSAVPTRYNDVQFRSLLEARWAVLFDALGITWEYEPKRFGVYLPDFRLFGEIYVEVKPPTSAFNVDPHEQRWMAFVREQASPLMVAYGVPRVDCYPIWIALNGEVSREFADLTALAELGPGYTSPVPVRDVHNRPSFVAAVKRSFEFGAQI